MPKIDFNSLLAKVPGSYPTFGYKKADLESPNEQAMEQDFAKLAFMFLQDRAAPLMKYLLGFEVVQKEADNSKAVGIFGFKIGDDYYYVPAFFAKNQIKGMDLIFSKRTNTFLPLQEGWINYIINKHTIELGNSAENNDKVMSDLERPNFRFLSYPRLGLKFGEDKSYTLKSAWEVMKKNIRWSLDNDEEFQKDWACFISKAADKPFPMEKTGKNSQLKKWMSEEGGPKAVSAFLSKLTSDVKFANAVFTFYPSVESVYVHEFSEKFAENKNNKVQVITREQISSCEMTENDKSKLLTYGFDIIDDRNDDEKSQAYNIDYESVFTNATEPGMYKILLKNGRIAKAYVLFFNMFPGRFEDIILFDKNGFAIIAEHGLVLTEGEKIGDIRDLYKKSIDIKDIEFDKSYILINEKGMAFPVFRLNHFIKEEGKPLLLNVYRVYHDYDVIKNEKEPGTFDAIDRNKHGIGSPVKNEFTFKLVDHKGSIKMTDNSTLLIPSNWRALEVKNNPDNQYNFLKVIRNFLLGTTSDLREQLFKSGFHKLTVSCDDGIEYYFRVDDHYMSKPMTYKKAYVDLVVGYGLSKEAAENILKEAKDNFKARRLIKLAQIPQGVGVNMPMPPDQPAGVDPYTGVPIYDMTQVNAVPGTMTGVPPRPNGNLPGINIGGETERSIDNEAMELAQRAAELGQKTVFDHATIGGLAKVYDTSAVVDSYLPEMMRALDRLGRIIFLFYWKNEDFAERYGTGDIAELEDSLRGVFKNFGDLILSLRQKAIDSDSNLEA